MKLVIFTFIYIGVVGFQPILASKIYRLERYVTYDCVKNTRYDWIIFNKSTLKITGGKDKMTVDGYVELLKDLNDTVSILGFLTRCEQKDPTDCMYHDREFELPSLCARTEKDFLLTHPGHTILRAMMNKLVEMLDPPIICPVIKKNKYFIRNFTIDLTVANFLPLEGQRWTTKYVLSLGAENPIPVVCLETEFTVRPLSKRKT